MSRPEGRAKRVGSARREGSSGLNATIPAWQHFTKPGGVKASIPAEVFDFQRFGKTGNPPGLPREVPSFPPVPASFLFREFLIFPKRDSWKIYISFPLPVSNIFFPEIPRNGKDVTPSALGLSRNMTGRLPWRLCILTNPPQQFPVKGETVAFCGIALLSGIFRSGAARHFPCHVWILWRI